jgi:putative ABC transport system permease protein
MMLDAVHERRQEIGIRLAIGATRRDVLWHFFLETLAVTAVGGLAGAVLGATLSYGLAQLEVPDLVPVPVFRWGLVGVAVGLMVAVGVLAALAPAWRAARVDPAVTLRME